MSYPSDGQNPYQQGTGSGQQPQDSTQSYQDPYAQTQSGTGPTVYSSNGTVSQSSTGSAPYAQQSGTGQASASDPYATNTQQSYGAQQSYGQQQSYGTQQQYAEPYGQQAPAGQQYGQGYYPDTNAAGVQPYGGFQPGGNAPARPHVSFVQAIKAWFQNYATFYGRANRGEFWWVYLLQILVGIIYTIFVLAPVAVASSNAQYGTQSSVSPLVGILGLLIGLWGLATLIPSIALAVRRLHDAGYSGWLYLLSLIPTIGGLIVLVLCAMPSKPEGARFDNPNGTQPKAGGAELTA